MGENAIPLTESVDWLARVTFGGIMSLARLEFPYQCFSQARGEFNNARARRVLVDWYLSLFAMCKAWHQYNER